MTLKLLTVYELMINLSNVKLIRSFNSKMYTYKTPLLVSLDVQLVQYYFISFPITINANHFFLLVFFLLIDVVEFGEYTIVIYKIISKTDFIMLCTLFTECLVLICIKPYLLPFNDTLWLCTFKINKTMKCNT